ncbi:hypothetical protein PI23P_00730 [Polaribacter irgensii 23-P]|uniref:Uncharacterized protein n=1 Tax=Polaribacter irgensii 23-P TaxID=313594 RepID=A4C283_9FLAO|nr:hypothetical protein PI23P_00730 [Polaribacter irgensii 23-P]
MFRETAIAQIIGIIGAIFIAKLYGAEAYGLFGFLLA